MRTSGLKIYIVDDEDAYFTPEMISIAAEAGFTNIQRFSRIRKDTLKEFISSPPEIIILDIKGIADPDVAKDGFGVAAIMYEQTKAFVVITSAHKYHLHEYHDKYDYVIHQRLLTAVDFVSELQSITNQYLARKIRFYEKLVFRIGFSIIKKAVMPSAD